MGEKTSNVAKNKIPCPKTGNGSWFLGKKKVGSPIVQPLLDPNCEFRQNASTEHAQIRLVENNRMSFHGSKVCNDDELVRHMSNLPSFLQKVEKEKSVQEKALNFGVLDWKQLEKWKYNEHVPAKCHHKASSSSRGYVCMAAGPPKMGPYPNKQYSSNGLNPCVAPTGKHPTPYSRFSSPHKKPSTAHISSSCSTKEVRNETHLRKENICEGKKTGTCDQEYQAAQSGCVDRNQNCHQRVENNYRCCSETAVNNCPRKDTNKKNLPGKKALSVELEHNLSLPKFDRVNCGVKKTEMSLIGVEFNPQNFRVQPLPHNVPKHLQMKSCSVRSQFTESGAKGNRISDLSPPQEFGGVSVEFPSSCSLPVDLDVHADSSIQPHNMATSPANEVDFYKGACPELNPFASVPSEGWCKTINVKTTRSTFSINAPKRSEADIAEQPAMKGRHPSLTRWLSFGFEKMNRSFKEMPTVAQLSSTYSAAESGPVTESSSGMNKFDRDKANANNRGTSNLLRRLLDPLIKYKGSQSIKIVQPPNGPLYSMTSGIPETMEPSQAREPEGVTGKSLLQLTLKNGLPFFKLVIENSSSYMLAAVVKRLPSNEENNHGVIYAFYSVHGTRKKSMTWTQGSKDKSCGLDYKIVGQMKISSFHVPKLHAKDSSHWAIRECVLYGVDQEQEDKQAPELLSDMEIAAVVMKSSCQNLIEGNLNDDQKPYQERGLPQCVLGAAFDVGEDEKSISTAVILPGGAHGNPSKGASSSLINRWRSGGSCDCGGWDVGCKVRVLTDNDKNGIISKELMSSFAIGRVNLFVQGGERKSKPVLNLESCDNGFYSLGLDPSIPFLEAFASSVAFITCQKFSEILDKSSQENVIEAINGKNKLKTATTFQGQIPAKYVSCPPLSPVGRI